MNMFAAIPPPPTNPPPSARPEVRRLTALIADLTEHMRLENDAVFSQFEPKNA